MSSVQRRIMDAIGARLALMTTTNGYARTVGKVTRATLKPFAEDDLPACNYWPGVDAFVSRGVGFVAREIPVYVEYYDRTRDEPFSDIVFELAQDAHVALTRSPSAPLLTDPNEPTLGGLVQSVSLTSASPQLGEGQSPWCGVMLTFTVSYRVKATDPSAFI